MNSFSAAVLRPPMTIVSPEMARVDQVAQDVLEREGLRAGELLGARESQLAEAVAEQDQVVVNTVGRRFADHDGDVLGRVVVLDGVEWHHTGRVLREQRDQGFEIESRLQRRRDLQQPVPVGRHRVGACLT